MLRTIAGQDSRGRGSSQGEERAAEGGAFERHGWSRDIVQCGCGHERVTGRCGYGIWGVLGGDFSLADAGTGFDSLTAAGVSRPPRAGRISVRNRLRTADGGEAHASATLEPIVATLRRGAGTPFAPISPFR